MKLLTIGLTQPDKRNDVECCPSECESDLCAGLGWRCPPPSYRGRHRTGGGGSNSWRPGGQTLKRTVQYQVKNLRGSNLLFLKCEVSVHY